MLECPEIREWKREDSYMTCTRGCYKRSRQVKDPNLKRLLIMGQEAERVNYFVNVMCER